MRSVIVVVERCRQDCGHSQASGDPSIRPRINISKFTTDEDDWESVKTTSYDCSTSIIAPHSDYLVISAILQKFTSPITNILARQASPRTHQLCSGNP